MIRTAAVGCALALAALVLAGCADKPQVEAETRLVSSSGAVTAEVPKTWSLDDTFRMTDPAGEGIHVSAGGRSRMAVYASDTFLRDRLGDDPYSFTFRGIQALLGEVERLTIGDGCEGQAVRPIEGGGFYGRAELLDGCTGGWTAEVRSAAVSARRTTVVFVTISARDSDEAYRLASLVLSRLRIDREALPRRVDVGTNGT